MPRHIFWPIDKIQALIELAQNVGNAAATLESERDAKLFRNSIDNYRRNKNVGWDIIVKQEGKQLTLTRKENPLIKIESI